MDQQNKYQVIVSEQAANMLISHAAFLAQSNSQAAERLIGAFEKAAIGLETMPQRHPWLLSAEIPKNVYRFVLFEKRYMLLFQIKGQMVYADFVVDCLQDYAWLLHEDN